MFATKPGYIGHYIEGQADGAVPNGQRVVKVADEKGDAHTLGDTATVISSYAHPELGLMYFIEWDDRPKLIVACISWKLAAQSKD